MKDDNSKIVAVSNDGSHSQVRVADCLQSAFKKLSPNWDIRDFVAVNPFFGQREKLFLSAMEYNQAVTGENLLPRFEFFKEKFDRGQILESDLHFAREQFKLHHKQSSSIDFSTEELLRALQDTAQPANELLIKCLSDQYDQQQSSRYTEVIQRQVSKWASAYFDEVQALWKMPMKEKRFFQAWKLLAKYDKSIDVEGFTLEKMIQKLPSDPNLAIEALVKNLLGKVELNDQELTNYFFRLLCTIQGWSSYFQKIEFEVQRTNDFSQLEKCGGLIDILAVRMSYDLLFLEHLVDYETFRKQLNLNENEFENEKKQYIWLLAAEAAYRRDVLKEISLAGSPAKKPEASIKAQMVFCIDVRSEVIRRHIEKANARFSTLGFAGFFGLTMSVKGLAHAQPDQQCPVLLNSSVEVQETVLGEDSAPLVSKKRRHSLKTLILKKVQSSANSCFSFVEVMGLTYIYKILKVATGFVSPNMNVQSIGLSKRDEKHIRPDIQSMDLKLKNQFAFSSLKNMGLTENFAPIVIFFGHGSVSSNNPYASGLDCGACAGHNGLSNSRILADILNETLVRDFLKKNNIVIPDQTLFVSGWHNTTQDCLNIDSPINASAQQMADIDEIKKSLKVAEKNCQKERALDLHFCESAEPEDLQKNLLKKAHDWSEIRPEWGLARNAAFIVANRSLTVEANLKGRTFLHEYDPKKDKDLSILELVMTAPMIVTNWINMQYYASTVSCEKFGSGNKVLHNVVSGIGCLQGNSSDLLCGLSEQSVLYKGKYFHEPLRLQVFINAKTSDIDQIIAKHKMVEELVKNYWLYIISIDPESHEAKLCDGTGWSTIARTH